MKNSILAIWGWVLFLLFSCSSDDEMVQEADQIKTTLSFTALLNDLKTTGKQQLGNIPECSSEPPAFVEVVVAHDGVQIAGTLEQPLRLKIHQDNEGNYFTGEAPELELIPGVYSLEFFRVLDEKLQVIWIAPRQEEGQMNFAGLVNDPLPLEIDLKAGTKKYVDVDVLCFDDRLVNYYGYLFFDLQANRAIKFCIFGNYCDESGRHIEAVRYNVSVWKFSGNDSAPKGNMLYQNVENGIWISDDFENGISETGSEPVCLALPDTAGDDQYYFEITLPGGLGSDAPASLIRRGVITDDDVKSLYTEDNNVDYYHFREGNCNLEDSPKLFEEVTDQPSVVEAVFLPAIQAFYEPRGVYDFFHEYTNEDVIGRTMMYERYPYRLRSEFHYSEHNELGLPQEIEYINYNVQGSGYPSTLYLTYSADNTIHTITTRTANSVSKLMVTEYDWAKRIIESNTLSESGDFVSRNVRQYDSEGRLQVSTTYSSETGTAETDIIRRDIFFYTSFGELEVLVQLFNGVERQFQYFYREDHTLKEYISRTYQEVPVIQTAKYDENERMIYGSIIQGDHKTEYISFFENGSFKIVQFYKNDFLYRIITYNEDRTSAWKIIEEDSSFRIEYKDAAGNIYRTEYYNSNGELISET